VRVEEDSVVLRELGLAGSRGLSRAPGGDDDDRLVYADHITARCTENGATPFHVRESGVRAAVVPSVVIRSPRRHRPDRATFGPEVSFRSYRWAPRPWGQMAGRRLPPRLGRGCGAAASGIRSHGLIVAIPRRFSPIRRCAQHDANASRSRSSTGASFHDAAPKLWGPSVPTGFADSYSEFWADCRYEGAGGPKAVGAGLADTAGAGAALLAESARSRSRSPRCATQRRRKRFIAVRPACAPLLLACATFRSNVRF
jgi:hypothetical protein